MKCKRFVSLSLDIGLIGVIDKERGLVSRSAYIENILKEKLCWVEN